MKELSFKPPNVFLDMSDDVESESGESLQVRQDTAYCPTN